MSKEVVMKRYITGMGIMVSVVAVLFFVGCGKKPVEQVKEVTPPTQEVKPEQEVKPVQVPEVPKVEEKPQVKVPSLEDQIKEFESEDIYFDFDRFNLRPEARKTLAEKASFLKAHPGLKVRIEGNCDERGTREYNLALGERRAKAAMDYLVFLGISPERISTISYGEERPIDPRHCEEAWSKNRRDHFVILGK